MTKASYIEEAASSFTGKWEPRIIYKLEGNEHSFTQLRKDIDGISNRVLSDKLKKLVNENIVEKEDETYSLTYRGQELYAILEDLYDWYRTTSKNNIYVVDPNKKQVELYQEFLQPEFDVYHFEPGQDPSKLLKADIVILERDSSKSVMSITDLGLDADIIFITSRPPDEKVLDKDFARYIMKPIDMEELKSKVQEVMNGDDHRRQKALETVIDAAAQQKRSDVKKLAEQELEAL